MTQDRKVPDIADRTPSLAAYLDRIGYRGGRRPDLATLDAIVRAHVATIAFENLDVQLGRRVTSDLPAIFAKLVTARRGGWCFEQNGLLGWALEQLGFTVMRVAGGVMRIEAGDVAIGNHLGLIVMLDRPWLADVGFGGSLAAPIPLQPGEHAHAPFTVSLSQVDRGYWRFEERLGGKPFSWDFRAVPADEARFAHHLDHLQTDAGSPFVENLVAQRRIDDAHLSLRGRIFSRIGPDGEDRHIADSGEEVAALLRTHFDLDVPEIAARWPAIAARHQLLFGDSTTA